MNWIPTILFVFSLLFNTSEQCKPREMCLSEKEQADMILTLIVLVDILFISLVFNVIAFLFCGQMKPRDRTVNPL